MVNLLNEGSPVHWLPPEILTRILYLAVDHGSEEHVEQVIPLTHVCRYWRMLLLSYPRMWSTLCMKPGNPRVISEWLARSQNIPLTVIAEFIDAYEHPPCRYEDSATATLIDTHDPEVCSRHAAILSLDQLLPHRSRIRDLNIEFYSSDPDWEFRHDDELAELLYHPFFKETLPNLQRLDFRAAHFEQDRYVITIPDFLFGRELPRLKELKYLGVRGGLTGSAKHLTSCEIGYWSMSAGPTSISLRELQTLFNNNKTIKSLTITQCEPYYSDDDPGVTIATPMKDLKSLKIHRPTGDDLKTILDRIKAPQFKSLDTIQLSLSYPSIQAVATDGSDHTFEFSQTIGGRLDFYPLRHLGADITTLHLDRGMNLQEFDTTPGLYDFFQSLDAVHVLEFDGAVDSVRNVLSGILSGTELFPSLKVIRVAIRDDCLESLPLLVPALRLRAEEGKPLTAIEPLFMEGEDGLGRAEWERHYEVEGIRTFLSE